MVNKGETDFNRLPEGDYTLNFFYGTYVAARTFHLNGNQVIANIAADAQVKILTGNAGGLDISLNGKTLDPIGPKGQTRTVRLTAEGPQLGPQNPPASSPL